LILHEPAAPEMPDLRRLLSDHDLPLLRLVAELWDLPPLAAKSQREAVDELAALMLQPQAAAGVIAALPPDARGAFDALAQGGRQPVGAFTRRHGELRAMGPARRDRERPWANNPSATESLWYRALVGRAFFKEGDRLEEYLFIPDDLRALVYIGPAAPEGAPPLSPPGRPLLDDDLPGPLNAQHPAASRQPPASGAQPLAGSEASTLHASQESATCQATHDAVTLLAYLHLHPIPAEALLASTPPDTSPASSLQLPASPIPLPQSAIRDPQSAIQTPKSKIQNLTAAIRNPAALPLLLHLLRRLGLLTGGLGRDPLKLDPEHVQPFLLATPAERQRQLAEAWRDAPDWNDLLHVPGLVFEGSAWRNDPLTARQAILGLLAAVPAGVWWSLPAFVQAVKERQPDFQRPAGDYASWYIRDAAGGEYLRGFENWERVDGALVAWLITRPLAWLGLVELATPGGPEPGFRLTPSGAALLGQAGWDAGDADEPQALDLSPDGLVRVPAAASALHRFQVARIADWLAPEPGPVYRYRLTPASLGRAARKGITPARILAFLESAAPGHAALPALSAALQHWERHGPEAALRDVAVLRLASPDLLDRLRREPSLRDLLGETLGPAAVAVRRADVPALRAALAGLGLLLDGSLDEGQTPV
jgi:hypothetical protein